MAEFTAPGADVLPVMLVLQASPKVCHVYTKSAKKPPPPRIVPDVELWGTDTLNTASLRDVELKAVKSRTWIVASMPSAEDCEE